jgi:hypothetical protein
MKNKFFGFFLPGFLGLCCLSLVFHSACSCSTEEAIKQILGSSSSEAPVLLDYKAGSSRTLSFQFSLPVRVLALNLSPELEVAALEEGALVTVHLAETPNGGERLTVDILVEDDRGNTLNALIPMRTRNDRMPSLLITELRTEYSKPKGEFVEFKTLSAGSLGALRLFIAGNYKQPLVYEFSPVEVARGEYILIHLRSIEEGIVDETGSDLNLSGGTDAVDGARDFWTPGTGKVLHKTDAVYFMDQDDRVIDAVMLSETSDPWWNKDYLAGAAELLFRQEAWSSPDGKIPGPAAAVITAGIKTAMTRSISRDETMADANGAADWYITATGAYSPGKPNKPDRF